MIKTKKNQYYSNRIQEDVQPSYEILKNLEVYLQSKTEGFRKIFGILFFLNNKYKNLYMTQTLIGEKAGEYSRGHTNRIIKELHDEGFISRSNRGVKRTCLYKISSYFNNPIIRSSLRTIFSGSIFLSLALLISKPIIGNHVGVQNITQLLKSIMNININNTTVPWFVQNIAKKHNISLAGCYKLMAFPDVAILDAMGKEKYLLAQLRDPLAWYLHECKNYCESNDLAPNWAIYYKLMDLAKLPLKSSHYITGEIAKAEPEKKVMSVMRTLQRPHPELKRKNRHVVNIDSKPQDKDELNQKLRLSIEKHTIRNNLLSNEIKLNTEFNQYTKALFTERWESLDPKRRDELISLAQKQITTTDILIGTEKLKTDAYLMNLILSDDERCLKKFAMEKGFSLSSDSMGIN